MGVLAGLFTPAYAEVDAQGMDMASLARLFVQAEEATGIPGYLFAAIAAQESSFWPWSVNLAGKSFYAPNKQDAVASIGSVKNFDLGLMQINSMWLPRFGVSIEDALDPAMNVVLGSTILMDCINRHGIYKGIACYHAGNPKKTRGVSYAEKVIAKWHSLKTVKPGPENEAGSE